MRRLFPLLLLLAAPLQAQTGTASPGHIKATEELLHLLGADSIARNAAPFFAGLKEQSPDVAKAFEGFYAKYLRWDELKPEFVAMYTSMFTEAEVRQLIAFYQSPVGTKMVSVTPQISTRTMEIVQRRMMPHMPELMEIISKQQAPQ
jgi:hypothetical protein